jgi:hypothetical protein
MVDVFGRKIGTIRMPPGSFNKNRLGRGYLAEEGDGKRCVTLYVREVRRSK